MVSMMFVAISQHDVAFSLIRFWKELPNLCRRFFISATLEIRRG
jgi:hypothetical protein